MREKYGIDAPGVVRTFAALGVVLTVVSGFVYALANAWWAYVIATVLLLTALTLLTQSLWMVYSSLVGKRRVWERALADLPLRGDERVIEVGPGRGAVLVTAARRIPSGRLAGVDIWRPQDQSGNGREALLANARAAGVADRVDAHDGDMRQLPFPDNDFDLALASLAIHNLPPADRAGAVTELARVVRPGGHIVILDFEATAGYADALRAAGASDVRVSGLHWSMHPPTRVVTAEASRPSRTAS
ncbi:class I SAM-dependent methyltransferase [Paractinoplanes globisporus]|uniref:Class I SAM-dependent methyltransferase n=1 Tax=Paractinoplanes globisporus TaxID=113565 RepID=A0ABW6WUS7_9ACTN|nr:class I SAM-dependent methyltransferase [Actinoplanes globisporus]